MFDPSNPQNPQPEGFSQAPSPDMQEVQIPMSGSASADPASPLMPAPGPRPMQGGVVAMPEKFMGGSQHVTAGTTGGTAAGGSGRRLLVIVVIVAIVLGAITVGAYFFFNSSLNPFSAPQPSVNTNQPINTQPTDQGTLTNDATDTGDQQVNENTSEDPDARRRDQQRISDVTTVAKALDAYYDEYDSYPQFLALIPGTMLSSIPKDPSTNAPYAYAATNNRQSYELVFEIEESAEFMNETLTADTYKLSPEDFIAGSEEEEGDAAEDETVSMNLDSDGDGLTLAEEQLLKTSATTPDTDGDSYADAVEVANYYSPIQSGAVRLDQAGLVKVYTNEAVGYSFSYPTAWVVSPIDDTQHEVLITSTTGENFAIVIHENPNNLTSWEWYVQEVSGDTDQSKVTIMTMLGVEAVRTPDGLAAYAAVGGRVFAIRYEVNNAQTVNYPNIFNFILSQLTLDS